MPFSETIFNAAALSIAAALLAEIAARTWIRRRGLYFVWSPHRRTHQRLDRPSLPLLPELARFEVNADGERGGPVPGRLDDCYRAVVLGASSTECRYLDQDSTWPAFAQAFLEQPRNLALLRARRVHLGNLGRSLATCAHLDLILEKVNSRYERLDAVIVMTGAGDVVRWLCEKAPAAIRDEPVDLDAIFDEHPERSFGWTPRDLALRRIASAIRRRWSRGPEVHDGAGRGIGRARALRASAAEIIDSMPDSQAMLARFEESFRRLLRRAQRSARTVIVVRPCWVRPGFGDEHLELGWMFAAGDLRTEEVRAWYSHRVADRLLDQIDRRIAAIARETGVPELDPKPLLDPGFAHFYDETHLAPAGCEIVGEAVAQAVLRERKGRLLSAPRAAGAERHADVA
jgi:hypothetical protein